MSVEQQKAQRQHAKDIERAAWFARLALGCGTEVPAMPQRQSSFQVMP